MHTIFKEHLRKKSRSCSIIGSELPLEWENNIQLYYKEVKRYCLLETKIPIHVATGPKSSFNYL